MPPLKEGRILKRGGGGMRKIGGRNAIESINSKEKIEHTLEREEKKTDYGKEYIFAHRRPWRARHEKLFKGAKSVHLSFSSK